MNEKEKKYREYTEIHFDDAFLTRTEEGWQVNLREKFLMGLLPDDTPYWERVKVLDKIPFDLRCFSAASVEEAEKQIDEKIEEIKKFHLL